MRDKRPAEAKYKPETYVELQYFSRIQVLNLNITKQEKIIHALNALIQDIKTEHRRAIIKEIKQTSIYQQQRKDIKSLVEQNHSLKVQISGLVTQKVKEL